MVKGPWISWGEVASDGVSQKRNVPLQVRPCMRHRELRRQHLKMVPGAQHALDRDGYLKAP